MTSVHVVTSRKQFKVVILLLQIADLCMAHQITPFPMTLSDRSFTYASHFKGNLCTFTAHCTVNLR